MVGVRKKFTKKSRGSLAWFGRQTHNQLLNIEWNDFEEWLKGHLARNYAQDVLRYSKKYADILSNNNTGRLFTLSKDKQRLVMSALSNLSKFLGIYQQWKECIKNIGLKWAKEDTFGSFIRIMNNNHSDLLEWYRKASNILNDDEKLYLKFMLLSGLRKNEGIQSFNLIIELHREGRLGDYFNENLSLLEHYKFKQFLRNTKNAYISIIPKDLVAQIAHSKQVSYSAIRKCLEKNRLKLRIKELRSLYASFMVKHNIISEEVDLLQGRVSKSVFVRHYLKESPLELGDRIFKALADLELSINN
jgi:intergrase/recombinase